MLFYLGYSKDEITFFPKVYYVIDNLLVVVANSEV